MQKTTTKQKTKNNNKVENLIRNQRKIKSNNQKEEKVRKIK